MEELDKKNSKIVKKEIVDYINKTQPICKGKLGELQIKCLKTEVPIIDRETAKFLEMIILIHKPKKILEIGCAVGFSSILMNKVNGDSEITTIDRFDVMINQAKDNFKKFGVEDKIKLLEGDARDILPTLDDKYDFIFLDSGKGQYIRLINDCLRLLKKDGVLIADDIFQNGNISNHIDDIPRRQRTIHRRLNEFLYKMCNTEGLESSLVPIGDGLLISYKKESEVTITGESNEK